MRSIFMFECELIEYTLILCLFFAKHIFVGHLHPHLVVCG